MRSLEALATAKIGGEAYKHAGCDAQFARTGRKGRARPGRSAAPGAQHTNREDHRNLTAVPANVVSAAAQAQSAPWARTGHGHNPGSASIRADRRGA